MNKPNRKPKDIVGMKFGNILILKELDRVVTPNGTIIRNFEGECICGTIVKGPYQNITKRNDCFGCKKDRLYDDHIGEEYGRLTILSQRNKEGKVLCKCACGNTKWIFKSSVRYGKTLSCGCYQKERTKESIVENNRLDIDKFKDILKVKEDKVKDVKYLTDLPEYTIIRGIISLCKRTEPKYAKFYLDRGIDVCSRWKGRNSTINFITDMGLRPTPQHKLQRIDTDKGFYPENCMWVLIDKK